MSAHGNHPFLSTSSAPWRTSSGGTIITGMMESWNGHFKQDYLWIREPMTFLETRQVADEGVVDYNTQRPHSSLEYLTPSEYAERKKEEQNA